MEQLIKEVEKIADSLKYGNIKIDLTISRGRITKVIIKERQRIILLDK